MAPTPKLDEKKHLSTVPAAPSLEGNDQMNASAAPPFQLMAGGGAQNRMVEESGETAIPFSPNLAAGPEQQAAPAQFKPDGNQAPIQKQDNQSPDQMIEQQTGTQVSGQNLSMSMLLGANQQLFNQPPINVHTGADGVRASAGISTSRLWVNFNPGMTITYDPGRWLPNVNISLQSYSWDFRTQQLNVRWRARRIVNWLGDPGQKIHDAMRQHVLSKVPSRMMDRGYDPFQDPNILTDLQGMFETSGGPAPEVPQNSNARLSAALTLDSEVKTDAGGYELVIPAGTRITVSANAAGGVSGDLSQLEIDSVSVSFGNNTANVDVSVLGESISAVNFNSLTFSRGGNISANYSLVTESLESLGRLFIMLAQLRSGQDMGVRSLESSRHEFLREKIDTGLNEELAPRIREVIIEHSDMLPGIDLSQVFGVS